MEEINVGYKFKQIRENAGLTLKQVSAMSGLSVSFISQIAVSYTHLTLPTT